MRLVTFAPQTNDAHRLGLLNDAGHVIDLTRVNGKAPFDATDMVSLVAAGDAALKWLRDVAAKSKEATPLDKVILRAPIPRPRKNVFCVGWNYLEHFEEGKKARPPDQEIPKFPTFFTKSPTAVNGPYDDVPLHAATTQKLDWEVELGVIIGKTGKNISTSDAMKHVFGYTVINDVSARDVQRQHGNQWFKGKSLDGSCPMGPWIATADAVAQPENLHIMCRVNGITKQDSNTKYLYFKIPQIIAELSAGLTLEPGDVISTGTPGGVGMWREPPEFMKSGDIMETEIVGLGLLRNKIVGA